MLDPKLTLSDYQITEIYVVSKGTGRLTQAFSTSDIMALRKEEERKQFQAKTGGGVFNLIFKRGKSVSQYISYHKKSVTLLTRPLKFLISLSFSFLYYYVVLN